MQCEDKNIHFSAVLVSLVCATLKVWLVIPVRTRYVSWESALTYAFVSCRCVDGCYLMCHSNGLPFGERDLPKWVRHQTRPWNMERHYRQPDFNCCFKSHIHPDGEVAETLCSRLYARSVQYHAFNVCSLLNPLT